MKIQPINADGVNIDAARNPQVGDVWDEHFKKLYLVLKVTDQFVVYAPTMPYPKDPNKYDTWNFGAVKKVSRARFLKMLEYGGSEMAGKTWADVIRDHWSAKDIPAESEWVYDNSRKIGMSNRIYKAPLVDFIPIKPHETVNTANGAHWELEPIEIWEIVDEDGTFRFEGCFISIVAGTRQEPERDTLYWQIVPKKHGKPFVSRFGRLARPEVPAKIVDCLRLQAKQHATSFDTFTKAEVFRVKKNWRGKLVEVKCKPIILPKTLWEAVMVHRDESFCI